MNDSSYLNIDWWVYWRYKACRIKVVWFKNFIGYKKHFELCLAPLETPHRGTSLYDFGGQLNRGERNLLRSSTNIGKRRMENINVYACYCQAISSIDWTLHTIIHGRTNNICRVCRVKPLIEFLYEKNVGDN